MPAHSKDGLNLIELRIEKVAQLFETFDPLPFREKDLDKDAEEYIVSWARELPRDRSFRIVIHAPAAELKSAQARHIEPALHQYFRYRAEAVSRDLNELMRVGRTSLAIGLVVLAVCVIAARFAGTMAGSGGFGRFIEESLIILGWVANWKPIEIFLYDWWPLARRRDLYRRLAEASIGLVEASPVTE
jgi:hypothetical protein